ncbi:hypothetical protein SAMN05443507_1531, partial [Alicyclobacillus tolerans]
PSVIADDGGAFFCCPGIRTIFACIGSSTNRRGGGFNVWAWLGRMVERIVAQDASAQMNGTELLDALLHLFGGGTGC